MSGASRFSRASYGPRGTYSNASASAAAGAIPGFQSYPEHGAAVDEFEGETEMAAPPPRAAAAVARPSQRTIEQRPIEPRIEAQTSWDTIAIPATFTQEMILRVLLYLAGLLPKDGGPLPQTIDLTNLEMLHVDHKASILGFTGMIFGRVSSIDSAILMSTLLRCAGYDRGDVKLSEIVASEYVRVRTDEIVVAMIRASAHPVAPQAAVPQAAGRAAAAVASDATRSPTGPAAAAGGGGAHDEEEEPAHQPARPPVKRPRVRMDTVE
jgi:hypothetical protein